MTFLFDNSNHPFLFLPTHFYLTFPNYINKPIKTEILAQLQGVRDFNLVRHTFHVSYLILSLLTWIYIKFTYCEKLP